MQLHLPKTLRVALIAAITTVGLTLAQASGAITAENAAGWAVYQDSAWVTSTSFVGSITTSAQSDIQFKDASENLITFGSGTRSAYTFAVELDLSKLDTPAANTTMVWGSDKVGFGVEAATRNVTAAIGSNPKWNSSNTALPTSGTITIVVSTGNGGSYIQGFNESGTQIFTNNYWNGLKEGNPSTYFHIAQAISPAVTKFAVWQADNNNTASTTDIVNAYNAMAEFPLAPPVEYTWNGTSAGSAWDTTSSIWNTSDKTGTNYVSSSTSTAIFGAGEELVKDVAVSGAIVAGTMQVQGDYKFTVGSGQSLTVGTLSVASGKTATVAGEGTINLDTLSGAGNLTVGKDGELTLNALSSYTGALGVADGGTLNLGANVTVSNLTVAGGTVTTQHSGGNGVVTNTLTIGQDGTFKVIGQHDAFGYNNGATQKIDMTGAAGHLATLALEQTTGNSVTMTTNIAMHGYSAITVKEGTKGFNTYGGTISADGVGNTIAVIDLRNAVTIEVAESGELAVGKFTRNGTSTAAVTKTGAGTMTITGASTLPGALNINGGKVVTKTNEITIESINLAAGTLEVDADDTTLGTITKTGTGEATIASSNTAILSKVIALQAGKLTMTGEYNIDHLNFEGKVEYHGGAVDGNGFAAEEGTVQVVSITEGATLDTTGGTFLRGGEAAEMTDGVATVSVTNYSGFYINSGEETLVQAKSMEYEHGSLSFITVKAGATLQVDDDMAGSLISADSAGTVHIQETKTVIGTMNGVALAGKGTYDLGSTTSLGNGTTLSEDWMGVVRISNVTKAEGNSTWINPLGNSDSWVEFTNFTGYDRAWASTLVSAVIPNIILTDDAEHHAAWNLTAYASTTYTMVLSGDVKGNGTFKTSGGTAAQSHAIEFQGDISEWEGAFVADAPGMRQVAFTGETMTVNASITKEGSGALNLVVGNGSDSTDAVFNADVDVSSIEVKANATATFSDGISLTTETVTNAGAVMFNTLEGLTQAISNTGDVYFNSDFVVSDFQETAGETGYFDLDGQFSTDGNGYAGTADSYLTIVDGGNVFGEVTVSQNGVDYTMSSDGRALRGDGGVTDHDTFHVNTGTVDISDVKTDGHASYVNVHSGTLNVDQDATGLAITVTEEGTLKGDKLDASDVDIEESAVAHFAQGLKTGGVEFSSGENSVDVYNNGDKAAFSLDNSNMVVSAQGITKTTGEDVIVSNWLYVDEITNVTGNTLTLDGLDDAVVVNNITVGNNSAVELLDNATSQEATVTITEALAASDGTLLANLVFDDNSALLVDGMQQALHVGSTLTMGQNIALDDATLRALDNLADGDYFWLIDAAEGRDLVYDGPTGQAAGYDSVFSRTAYGESNYTLQGNFNIVFNTADGFGLQKFGSVPEPTTGTLGLLALAALAARRRRK